MADFTEQQKAQENLDHILRYGNIRGCRRKFLLRYFNEDYDKNNCGNCDGCVAQTPLQLSKVNFIITKPKISYLSNINGTYDHKLFDELRKVRTEEAYRLKVPPYIIFGDKSLREMATHFPQTSTAFLQISGVGDKKLSQFGEKFMFVIRQYVEKNKMEEKTRPTYISLTFEETEKLLLQKIDIDKIVKNRRLSFSTIISHIEKISTTDPQLDIEYLKPPHERFEKIAVAFQKTGGFALNPVREILGCDYSYDELRLARIFIKRL